MLHPTLAIEDLNFQDQCISSAGMGLDLFPLCLVLEVYAVAAAGSHE